MRAWLLRAAVATLAGVAGCSLIVDGCTLIGCEGKLTIAFDTPPATVFHLEAISVTSGQRTFDCTDVTKCTSVDLSGYTPDRFIITVTTARGTRQFNFAPDYQNTYANGPHCGVTCRSATVRVALP